MPFPSRFCTDKIQSCKSETYIDAAEIDEQNDAFGDHLSSLV